MRRWFAALMAVLTMMAVACTTQNSTTTVDGPTVPTSPIETRVVIDNFAFTPRDLVVQPGTTVEWQNRAEGTSHTSTAVDGMWDSGNVSAGGSFSFTFTEPGTFDYVCAIHPSMEGTITVEG